MKQPEMTVGTVEMVSVEWIMNNTTSSIDGFDDYKGGVDYLRMVASKGGDRQIGEIMANILTFGFRSPIVLAVDDDSIMHGNGHHRMVAAILLVLDEIPVYWARSFDWMADESEREELVPISAKEWRGVADMIQEEYADIDVDRCDCTMCNPSTT